MTVQGQSVEVPASPWAVEWESERFAEAPALDAQGAAIRAEFAAGVHAAAQPGAERAGTIERESATSG
jgi:hypothetical protein